MHGRLLQDASDVHSDNSEDEDDDLCNCSTCKRKRAQIKPSKDGSAHRIRSPMHAAVPANGRASASSDGTHKAVPAGNTVKAGGKKQGGLASGFLAPRPGAGAKDYDSDEPPPLVDAGTSSEEELPPPKPAASKPATGKPREAANSKRTAAPAFRPVPEANGKTSKASLVNADDDDDDDDDAMPALVAVSDDELEDSASLYPNKPATPAPGASAASSSGTQPPTAAAAPATSSKAPATKPARKPAPKSEPAASDSDDDPPPLTDETDSHHNNGLSSTSPMHGGTKSSTDKGATGLRSGFLAGRANRPEPAPGSGKPAAGASTASQPASAKAAGTRGETGSKSYHHPLGAAPPSQLDPSSTAPALQPQPSTTAPAPAPAVAPAPDKGRAPDPMPPLLDSDDESEDDEDNYEDDDDDDDGDDYADGYGPPPVPPPTDWSRGPKVTAASLCPALPVLD